jgi:hypothetical protein
MCSILLLSVARMNREVNEKGRIGLEENRNKIESGALKNCF